MKLRATLLILLLGALSYTASAQVSPPKPYGALPSQAQVDWQKMEYYMFVHFGPNTFERGGDGTRLFNPTDLDCRQWAATAKAAGMTGIILTVKHHDGFCLWPSKYSTYTVRESVWKNGKGDVLKELSEACREYGLKLGVYLSPWDRNHPAYGTPEYNRVFANTLNELLGNYGEVFEQWFDGANGEGPNGKKQVYDWALFNQTVLKKQPNTIIFSDVGPGCRWMGNENGIASETNWSTLNITGGAPGTGNPPIAELQTGVMGGEAWVPAETDVPIGPGWSWSPGYDDRTKTLDQLMNIYYTSVGRNSNLLLNVGPDRTGHITRSDSVRLMEFRRAREEAFAENLAQGAILTASNTRGGAAEFAAAGMTDDNYDTYWATDDSETAPYMEIDLRSPKAFNRLLLQEYIPLGQRVSSFTVSTWNERGQRWVPLTEATTVGYKRILRFPMAVAQKIRIDFDALACPAISSLALYLSPEILSTPVVSRDRNGIVTISTESPDPVVYYTNDGTEPTIRSRRYQGPFAFAAGGTIKTVAVITKPAGGVAPSAAASAGDPRAMMAMFERESSETVTAGFDLAPGSWKVLSPSTGEASAAVDANPRTAAPIGPGEALTVDLGGRYVLKGFTYTPASGREQAPEVSSYDFDVSADGRQWTPMMAGASFEGAATGQKRAMFDRAVAARYIRFKPTAAGPGSVPVAELGVVTLSENSYSRGLNITPMPLEVVRKDGVFTLDKKVVFATAGSEAEKIAAFFAARIRRSTGNNLKIRSEKPASGYISLSIEGNIDVNDEGYLLDVSPAGIDIKAKTPQGLFYAMQTVMQLLPPEIESPTRVKTIEAWNIPAVSIMDEPRFGYRGMHLDVCRHFVDVDFIKKQLDVLAMFKINTFHWHLTDDQGWRIEIKKYPLLTTVGAQRIEGEGDIYGPFFFTQDQIREVVAYAGERFIEVIPEIELPGHGVAAITAYPELGCTGLSPGVRNIWGVSNDVFCAGNEQVFTFLEDVLTEVIPLFESDYIHIGGDECPKGRWEECPKCQARIKELGLVADNHNSAEMKLQSWFVQRIGKFLEGKGKKMIGWDEILEGGLAPSATVMSWRGEQGGIEAANMGHDVIMTPGDWMYLDKYQGDPKTQPVTIGGYMTLSKTYSYEPLPDAVAPDKLHHILGAQANVWTEYKYTGAGMEHDIYPRILAVAELNWTPRENKNYKDFERRLDDLRVRLDMHDVNYYIPGPEQADAPSVNFVAFTDRKTLEFSSTEPVKIVYTTDGTEPGVSSQEYTTPLTFTSDTTLKIRSVLPGGKMGSLRTITLEKQDYTPAVAVAGSAPKGIKAEYYKGNRLWVADLDGLTPDETEYVESPQRGKYTVGGAREIYPEDYCSTVFTGYIDIPEDGVYYFNTDCELWLDGAEFISNEKDNHGTARRFSRSDRSVALAKGFHSFKLIRMGAIFGGWPAQWSQASISIRKEGEAAFRPMGADYFR